MKARGTAFVVVALGCLASSTARSDPPAESRESLVESLRCKVGQSCDAESPAPSRRRGVASPKRGFQFRPGDDAARREIDDLARKGALPSTNIEVLFDFDDARITASAQQSLRPLGEALADPRLAGARFALVGHTDGKGDATYNQGLSERRATAVKNHLVSMFGIAPTRLEAYGRGMKALKNAQDPFASENRRVQVINVGADTTSSQ